MALPDKMACFTGHRELLLSKRSLLGGFFFRLPVLSIQKHRWDGLYGKLCQGKRTEDHSHLNRKPQALTKRATVSTCCSLSKLIFISSSMIGNRNLMDFSHWPLG